MAPSKIYEMVYQESIISFVRSLYEKSGITDPRLMTAVFAYDDARSFLSNLLCLGLLDENAVNFINERLLKRLDVLEACKEDQQILHEHAQYIGNGMELIFRWLREKYGKNSTREDPTGEDRKRVATNSKSDKRAMPISTRRDDVIPGQSKVRNESAVPQACRPQGAINEKIMRRAGGVTARYNILLAQEAKASNPPPVPIAGGPSRTPETKPVPLRGQARSTQAHAASAKGPARFEVPSSNAANKPQSTMPGSWESPNDLAPEPRATWEAIRKARSTAEQPENARPTRNTLTLRDLAHSNRAATSVKQSPEDHIPAGQEVVVTLRSTKRTKESPLAVPAASGALHNKPSTTSTSAIPNTEGKVSDIPKAIEVANVPKPWTVEDKLSWLAGDAAFAGESQDKKDKSPATAASPKEKTEVENNVQEDADWEVVVNELEEDFVMLQDIMTSMES